MEFRFHPNVIHSASMRQDDGKGFGIPCAKCGTYLDMFADEGKGWFAIPKVPINQGGKKTNNCVIVCPKCCVEFEQDGTKIIPSRDLRFFRRV